jgi:signal peptidase I
VQVLRVTRRAIRRPWYRNRIDPPAAAKIREASDALSVAIKTGADAETLHPLIEKLEDLFDRHLTFMKISIYVEYVLQVALAVLVAFVLRESLVEAFKIPSGSMLPALEVGDHIFVNKLSYGVRFPFTAWIPVRWGEPERGDVIVFRRPEEGGDDFIKRVIAVGGDRLRVERDGTLVINGRTVRRCPIGTIRAPLGDDRRSPLGAFDLYVESLGGKRYVTRQTHERNRFVRRGEGVPAGDLFADVPSAIPSGRPFPAAPTCPVGTRREGADCVVTEGFVFMMGDNRDNSRDSRFWGAVPLPHIKGRAMFIWWSNADRSVALDRIGISILDPVEVTGGELTEAERSCLRELESLPPDVP